MPSSAIVVASATEDAAYSQYVAAWIRTWRMYGEAHGVNIHPIVLVPESSAILPSRRSSIVQFPVDSGLPLSFQAQVNRLLAHNILRLPGQSILFTADIDMFPGTDEYLLQLIQSTPSDSFVVGRNVLADLKQYPICYLGARVDSWHRAFTRDMHAQSIWSQMSVEGDDAANWFIDQKFAFAALNLYAENTSCDLVLWEDRTTNHIRLDRSLVSYVAMANAFRLNFSDYHAHRHYTVWKFVVKIIQWRLAKKRRSRRHAPAENLWSRE